MTDLDAQAREIVAGLSEAQRRMLLASDPDDITGEQGCGVELTTGALYATAKSLKARDLGEYCGPGGPWVGMYSSNDFGLAVRRILNERPNDADE